MWDLIKNFLNDEEGQGMTEYIILVALIAIAVIVAVVFFRDQLKGLFFGSANKLNSEYQDAMN